MENVLWELFCETGDPMGYLLYRTVQDDPETVGRDDPGAPKQTLRQTARPVTAPCIAMRS